MDHLRRIRLIGLIDWFLPGVLLAVALMAAAPAPEASPDSPSTGGGQIPLPLATKLPHGSSLRLAATREPAADGRAGEPAASRRNTEHGHR